MDILKTKAELDALYSRMSYYPFYPEWHTPAATDEEIAAAEARLGVTLPTEVQKVCKVLSGIRTEASYFMGEEFHDFKNAVNKALGEEEAAFLEDNLFVNRIFSLSEWGVIDEMWNPKQEYREVLECELEQGEEARKEVCYGCEQGLLLENTFIHIGHSEHESIFIDLNPKSKHFGAFYNIYPSDNYAFLLIYKIADNYFHFLERLKKSLEIQLQSEGA